MPQDKSALNKVFKHPEKEEIIKKILSGESVKVIEEWLKKKHPKKRSLWISYATLQKFRKENMNIEGDILAEIKEARRNNLEDSKELEAKVILAASNSYQEKLKEIATIELDTNRKIMEMSVLIGSRMEYYFNMIQTNPEISKDKMFLELINTQRALVQDWKKYVEGVADKKFEHNVNINIVNEQVTVLKNIVFEVLQELEPRLIPIFVEKINNKLLSTVYGDPQYKTYQQLEAYSE